MRNYVSHIAFLAAVAIAISIIPPSTFSQGPAVVVSPDRIDDVTATGPDPTPFDHFSWRAFIALNWPALPGSADRGKPDRSKSLGDAGARVWETYKARFEVFRPLREAPADWADYSGPNPCGAAVTNQEKTLSAFSKYADFNQASQAVGSIASPLVAQNRTYTRFEVRFNEAQFKSIVANKWYQKLPTKAQPGKFDIGSIEVKAAWRILTASDTPQIRARYYVVQNAQVLDVAQTQAAGGNVVCSKQDIALVGVHIVIKTIARPQWIWSSFEHVDNVPPKGGGASREPDAKDAGVPYSYNDGDPTKQSLNPAAAPPGIRPDSVVDVNPAPMQVVRIKQIDPRTMDVNRAYWAHPQIKNTVWANYMLVMTQWPTQTSPESVKNSGQPFPRMKNGTNLANTTMETYEQEDPPGACMGCHHSVANANGRDFVAFMAVDLVEPSSTTFTAKKERKLGTPPRPQDPGIEALVRVLKESRKSR